MHLEESVAEGARQHFAASVFPWRILRGKEHELGMRPDDCVGFGDVQLAIIVEETIQCFEHFGRSEIQLIENDPVPVSQRLDQQSFVEDELTVGRGDVNAGVVLQIGVFVVVDSNAFVARQRGEAWTRPFVAVFEPSSNAEPSEIESVSYFKPESADSTAVGIVVTLKSGRRDYIFSSVDGAEMTYRGITVSGRYAVVSDAFTLENGVYKQTSDK